MTNETPPVPPNCQYFKNGAFVLPDDGSEIWLDGRNDDPQSSMRISIWRPIIAAVASMYWRREASSKLTVNIDEHLLALDNAAAWERWAEGERG